MPTAGLLGKVLGAAVVVLVLGWLIVTYLLPSSSPPPPPAPSASAPVVQTTSPGGWNRSDKSPNIGLSNHDGTATQGNAPRSWSLVRAQLSRTTGKWYFRLIVDGIDGGSGWIGGIAGAAAPLNGFVGASPDGAGFQPGQNFYQSGKTVGGAWSGGSLGDVIDIAVDLDAHRIWAKVERPSAVWNQSRDASPAAGTGGLDIGAIKGPVFPAWSGFNSDKADAATLDITTALSDKALDGFSQWARP